MTGDSTTRVRDGFAEARKAADAVLFEGYVLYPYRASAAKNRMRWQFGVLVPQSWEDAGGEHAHQRTECLLEPRGAERLVVELRFLHVRRRTVERPFADGGGFEEVPELELPDRVLVPWDEGSEERIELAVPLEELSGDGHTARFTRPWSREYEAVEGADGRTAARLRREAQRLEGEIRLRMEPVPGPYGAMRLTATVRNTSPWAPPASRAGREDALPYSLVGAHLLLGLPGGRFVSMTDPPEWARPAAEACRNEHTWPVLATPDGDDVLLSSPIILEDRPQVAAESAGTLYDATEIDEILSLRTAALTEGEKREARGTDQRAAEVIDLVDTLPSDVMERLHGAIRGLREVTRDEDESPADGTESDRSGPDRSGPDRSGPDGKEPDGTEPPAVPSLPTGPGMPWWDPGNDPEVDPDRDTVSVSGCALGAGSRVALRPGQRRTDAQDIFLHGRTATVEAVLHDVDGEVHFAVVVDGDPGADVRREQGRFLYFRPDEVEPLTEEDV
ncbi:hypothetical protein [Wenjunlia tyrosinilytica]|uniref:Uncharacterized protein n=1 Tax=Wenjunlia tyrosinilytica TaxID=1544741 RepID=A0A918DWP7_9ACTN|nr:hypothetical protein [Wenjunlia tyrosinilytica]GGO87936.1 hypothetical protein GCM10012280_27560 [Wenjunlia tyrosinilytica]